MDRGEKALLDLRFRWRGSEGPHPQIAVLAINKSRLYEKDQLPRDLAQSRALQAMTEKEYPWRRVVWKETLDKLFAAGARLVVFDIVFASETADDPEFAAAIAKYADRVVLAMTVLDLSQEAGTQNIQLVQPNPAILPPDATNLVGCATVHSDSDDDQTIRRADAFTSALRELGHDDDTDEIPGLAALAVTKLNGNKPKAGQRYLIRYQGGRQTYAYYPLEDLFKPAVFAGPPYQNGAVFRDKVVFIGATYELAHDDKATPMGVMAGVEVHAHIAGDLLTGSRLHDVTRTGAIWVMVGMCLAPVAIVAFLRRAWLQAVAILLLLLGFTLVCQWSFAHADLVLPMVSPLVGAAAIGLAGILLSFVQEQWEKAHTRRVLERSVSKRIANVMLRNAEEFDHARRGERRSVVILFSDIRGFTTLSERAEPEHLVGQLNEYFERMVDIVERTESFGNAQKFIGDAILACWGDTPENQFGDAEDARRAVAAALNMRVALKELNVTWDARPDRSVIKFGIGINLGAVVVGEVGHPERREYTVLGDGVNFAARLESATKQFQTDILVGENVEELTRDHFVYRHADFVRVKGKTKPVDVFIPLSDRQTPPPEWLADYHRGRALYLERKFLEAAVIFRDVQTRIGQEDFLCVLYRDLCDRFTLQAPPPEWDGSRELTEK